MALELLEHCVYTIVHPSTLEKAACDGNPTTLRESKAWVTGRNLLEDAQAANIGLAILFGDATDCSRLEYWGLLTDIKIKLTQTVYSVDKIRRLSSSHAPQDLVLKNTGNRIATKFIRPYAICNTPDFIGYRIAGKMSVAVKLSEHCIYTILHPSKLEKAACDGNPKTFRESKVWVTGRRLLEHAQAANIGLPILFGDATDCSRLEYWGLLTHVKIKGTQTVYSVDKIRRLPSSHAPQELVLKRKGNPIAANFIRPYAICNTPEFIAELGNE
jgi:hypothetical protein